MPGQGLKPRPPLPEGPFLVVGLARSGTAAARVLTHSGETVIGTDSGHPEEAERLAGLGVEVHLDGLGTELLDRVNAVVKSPGVPGEAPAIAEARARGLPVLGELEIAWRLLPNRFIGVTGTNGKTTVTEWIGHLFREDGQPVEVAGNVGSPLSDLVGEADQASIIVTECSSFQLEDSIGFAPECGVFLNLSEDHLDRHGTIDRYLESKLRLFANQGPEDFAIVAGGDAYAGEWDPGASGVQEGAAATVSYCLGAEDSESARLALDEPCAMKTLDGALVWRGDTLLDVDELALPGPHNVENAMAATAAALIMGVETESVRRGLQSFPGLPHRLERVAEIGGVTYVNDSKATNPAAAAAAIRSFGGPVRAILGGSLKGGGFDELVEPVAERCAACYLIGAAAERIASDLSAVSDSRSVAIEPSGGLADAVAAAACAAQPGDVVLLAPACASFDVYRDFEERGEHFRSLVASLADEPGEARSR